MNHVNVKEPSVDRPRERTALGAIGLSVSQTSINLKRTIGRSAYMLITHYSTTDHRSFGPTQTAQ